MGTLNTTLFSICEGILQVDLITNFIFIYIFCGSLARFFYFINYIVRPRDIKFNLFKNQFRHVTFYSIPKSIVLVVRKRLNFISLIIKTLLLFIYILV